MSELDAAHSRYESDGAGLFTQLRESPNPVLVRLAYDRMLELKGKRGIDTWRGFLGLVGYAQQRALEGRIGREGFDPDDYGKAVALTRWWLDWSRSQRRAERVRVARVPGEPRPTVAALIQRDGITCWRCGEDCDVTPDDAWLVVDPESGRGIKRNPRYRSVGHVIRLVDGGQDTMDNAKLECWECNSADGIPHVGPLA